MSPSRTGARRMADIPPKVKRQLDRGEIESKTLVEMLAIDGVALLGHLLDELAVGGAKRKEALAAARALADAGILDRTRGTARILFDLIDSDLDGPLFTGVAGHRSDTVRSWGAYMVGYADLPLAERLARMRQFAADGNMGVREYAWMSYRPHLAGELAQGIKLLKKWVADSDPNIRRCAVESTRPRGVWCAHIPELKERPEQALPLLEPVRSDDSKYVRDSAANWLNDASKSRPEWVREVTARWEAGSPTKQTAYVIRRGLRSLDR